MNSKRTNNNEFLTKMKKMIDNLEGNLIQQKKIKFMEQIEKYIAMHPKASKI